MSWIGLRDASEGVLSAVGLGHANRGPAPDPDSLLVRDPWPSALTLCLDTDGTLRLLMRHGAQHLSRELATDLDTFENVVQITYSWDCPARHGTLSLYLPDHGKLFQTEVSAPFPLSMRDATRLMADHFLCKTDASLHLLLCLTTSNPRGLCHRLARTRQ